MGALLFSFAAELQHRADRREEGYQHSCSPRDFDQHPSSAGRRSEAETERLVKEVEDLHKANEALMAERANMDVEIK